MSLSPLVRLLDLERIDTDIFRGQSARTSWLRVFGGQVAGQALIAAGRTVDPDRHVHSLHSYFIRPGDSTRPIVYEVERVRDGRSFATRRVVAVQGGERLFVLSASFQLAQDGIEHSPVMPDAPDPETLPTLEDYAAQNRGGDYLSNDPRPLDVRIVDPPHWALPDPGPRTGPYRVWLRTKQPLTDDPLMHIAVVTFASDLTLLDTVLVRHGVSREKVLRMASLDHAMWFMRPPKADDWMLYVCESPAAIGGRGLATGRFFDRTGRHLASAVQEGMIRVQQ